MTIEAVLKLKPSGHTPTTTTSHKVTHMTHITPTDCTVIVDADGTVTVQLTAQRTATEWASIDGLADAYHGQGGSWLVTDRRALGRGHGKPSANTRYRWQVLSGDQSHAYGCRLLRIAKLFASIAAQYGVNQAIDSTTAVGDDVAKYPVIGKATPVTLGGVR